MMFPKIVFQQAALAAAFSCALFVSTAACAAPNDAVPPTRLDESLAKAVESFGVPGIAAAVFDGSGILAIGIAGVREQGKPAPIELNDSLHLGSCTKAMTATVMATLVEEGVLWWDMPLPEAFPKLADQMHESFRKVTLANALNHRAGVASFTAGNAPEFELTKNLEGSPLEQRREFVRRLLTRAPAITPCEKFQYSNASYSIIAAAMEAATDIAWEDLMSQRLFGPLNMADSGIGWPATPERPDQPMGHIPTADGLSPLPLNHPYKLAPCLAPAGDARCSIADFARFAQFHLAGIRSELGPKPPISQQNFMRMHMPAPPGREYAMGWLPARRDDSQLSWHNGSAGTFFALMTLDPDHSRGVVVITNSGGGEKACIETSRALMTKFIAEDAGAPAQP